MKIYIIMQIYASVVALSNSWPTQVFFPNYDDKIRKKLIADDGAYSDVSLPGMHISL